MFNLSSFLDKFKDLKDPRINKTTIASILKEYAGVQVTEQNIDIQKETVFIQESGLVKNRIFMNREIVLQKIQEVLPDLSIKNIL